MNRLLTAFGIASALTLTACENEQPQPTTPPANQPATAPETPPADQPTGGASGALGNAIDRAQGLAQQAGTMLGDTKEQILASSQKKLEELRPQVESLKANGERLSGEARQAFGDAIAQLDGYLNTIDVKLSELRDAGSDQWKQIGSDLSETFQKLTAGIADVKQRFGLS